MFDVFQLKTKTNVTAAGGELFHRQKVTVD